METRVTKTTVVAFWAMTCLLPSVQSAQAQSGERAIIGKQFAIDGTEVTIAEFRAFAEAGGLLTKAEASGGGFEFGSGWEKRIGWTIYRPFGDNSVSQEEPAVHVSWDEAGAFCAWHGGRLPTAEEWRLAAYTEMRTKPTRGYEAGRTYIYPSGEQPTGMNTSADDPWPRHAPAGATPPGVNGLSDMGGNVWEWLADREGDDALTAGGSWWYGPDKTTAGALQWKPADFFAVYVGFRCAYDAVGAESGSK